MTLTSPIHSDAMAIAFVVILNQRRIRAVQHAASNITESLFFRNRIIKNEVPVKIEGRTLKGNSDVEELKC